jgi:hypothetical protein
VTPQDDSFQSLIDDVDCGRAQPSGAAPTRDWRRLGFRIAAPVLCVVALALITLQISTRPPDYGAMSRQITLVDTETGEVFKEFKIKNGDTEPWAHPRTGRRTLYSPEYCFWNADGTGKTTPTYVILNAKLGIDAPTTCPDCGRVVVRHNPEPPVDVMLEAFSAEHDDDRP